MAKRNIIGHLSRQRFKEEILAGFSNGTLAKCTGYYMALGDRAGMNAADAERFIGDTVLDEIHKNAKL